MRQQLNDRQKMINNYFEHQYHACNKVHEDPITKKAIYLGDISAALDLSFIKEQRIKTVITAAIGMDHVFFDSSIHHIVYPLLDMKSQNISKLFHQFYMVMEKQLTHQNVLVHCAAGISRSATLVISYLMKKNNWSFRNAIQYVRQSRPNVCPNLGFERQLKQYEIFLGRQNDSRELTANNQRRIVSKTSEERKHLSTPLKLEGLPEIGMLGKTQLRTKILDPFSIELKSSKMVCKKEDEEVLGKRMTFKPKKTKSLSQRQSYQSNQYIFHNLYNHSTFKESPLISHREATSERVKLYAPPIDKIEQVVIKKLNLHRNQLIQNQNYHPIQLRTKPLHKLALF